MGNPPRGEKMEVKTDPRAYPMAKDALTTKILNLGQQAVNYKQLKKGANEATKALNRGQLNLSFWQLMLNLWKFCYTFPYYVKTKMFPMFLLSKQALGRACGVSRPVIAAVITQNEGSQIKPQIITIQQEIEKLLV